MGKRKDQYGRRREKGGGVTHPTKSLVDMMGCSLTIDWPFSDIRFSHARLFHSSGLPSRTSGGGDKRSEGEGEDEDARTRMRTRMRMRMRVRVRVRVRVKCLVREKMIHQVRAWHREESRGEGQT